MKAMILAAGEGTRLQPLTYDFPKPLVPIANKPVMEHILNWLAYHEVTDIVVNTHYRADQIERYFQDGENLGVNIQYSREEKLWGTAGGVKRAKSHFQETFLVIGGDDLSDVNLTQVVDFHKKSKAVATIGVKEVEDTRQFGVVIHDAHGKIKSFQEKPKPEEALSHLANTGIYIFEPAIFDFIPDNEVFDFGRQVFPLLLEKKAPFFASEVTGYWCDIGSLKEYKESHWAILESRCAVKIPGRMKSPGIWMDESVSIHPSAKIVAPCILGSGTVVEEHADLLGHVVTGRNTVIGRGARLNHVIAWDDCMIEEGAILRESVLSEKFVKA